MNKRIKIAFIGAGSLSFTRRLIQDLLCVREFRDNLDFALHDINEHNLSMVHQIVQRDIRANGLGSTVSSSLDRRESLKDADYVVCCVRIGGLDAFRLDIEIPLQYGVDQCVGDTLAPGGIMYGQRSIAAMLDFCRDIREVSKPGVLLLNYANPNAMNTWACNQYGKVRTIGLCHGVQHGAKQITEALGAKPEEIDYTCVGINHQTWYVEVRRNGIPVPQEEIYQAMCRHPEFSRTEKVRLDMFRRFGYYSTESNGHLSEYVPWYRKRPAEILRWIDFDSWIHGETGGYLRVCTEERNWFEYEFPQLLEEAPAKLDDRSHEHGSYIIEALETGRIYRGHFNVMNQNQITNLPAGCVVELPGYVDRNGISIPVYGDLPMACAATCAASVRVQEMSVKAAVSGNVQLLKLAMLHDPLTAAVCNPEEVWQMTDDMLLAQEQWLPQYRSAIEELKQNPPPRIQSGALPVTPETRREVRPTELIAKLRKEQRLREAAGQEKAEYNPDKRI